MSEHTIQVADKITFIKRSCPCKTATVSEVTATVLKVITINRTKWYYTDIGVTVNGNDVVRVHK